ncbi:MAG TPA: MFS transporter [Steroidobacteraceae bacterium]|jgi:MFS family permease|nr:MFS transporter [Steroidobacteraceae bacterium]
MNPRAQRQAHLTSASLALAVLTFINLLNYLDRFVVSALAETLKHSSLALSDFQLGSLMTSFLLVYLIAAPVFGALGDRRPRPRLIAFGVGVWSLATALSGFAGSYLALLGARAVVGIGEAAYGTIAPALLADYFPAERRGRIMAVFFCAIPIGAALGYVVGGLVDARYGWRMAFFVAGAPGLALAALTLMLRDPPRGSQDAGTGAAPAARAGTRADLIATYARLTRNSPYVLTVFGYAAYTFAVGGLGFWMPAFLERVRGIPRAQATVSFGEIVVITGFVGTFAGGWLGDYCAKFSRQAFLWVSAVATLIAAPFAWAALTTASPVMYLGAMVIAQLCLFVSTGPINAAIVNLTSPLERASAIAVSIFTIHILGDVLSPPLIGVLSDLSSLQQAVKIVPVAVAISGLLWCWAAHAGRGAPRGSAAGTARC